MVMWLPVAVFDHLAQPGSPGFPSCQPDALASGAAAAAIQMETSQQTATESPPRLALKDQATSNGKHPEGRWERDYSLDEGLH